MGRSLDDYSRKRDFDRTPEPPARPRPRDARVARGEHDAGARSARFVVHRHEARRLHYDLRLEIGAALKSWAVPRGFSYDPSDKRLAVHTEDHPLEYLEFAGVIPKGEYGAGTMVVWDSGTWEIAPGHRDDALAAVAAGELKVVLHGRRLRGEWHLVKTRGEDGNWLLFKSKDRYCKTRERRAVDMDLSAARAADAMPKRLTPMRTARECEAFEDPAWLFEVEFAGQRALLVKDGDDVEWRGAPRTLAECLPAALVDAARALRAERAIVDGVLVALDAGGRPSREALDELAARAAGGAAGDTASPALALTFQAFDLLHFDGLDLRELPLVDRKEALAAVLPAGSAVQFVDHVAVSGVDLAASATSLGLPALIAKRRTSAYGTHSHDDWRRIPLRGDSTQPLAEALEALSSRAPRAREGLTNLDKVYWPEQGFTKGELLDYYESISGVLLPYLRDRPVHLNRFPDGIHGKSFYQKALRDHGQPWIRTFHYSGSDGDERELPVCDDLRTLLYLVNLGSIDLHPWLSRCASPRTPDWLVLDLDPKEAPFANVVRIARTIGRVLRGIGLRPFLKTSGKTGLHVHVPLVPEYDYDQARMFAEGIARLVVREHKDIATIERNPASRGGRVYVDYMQNRRGQTVVPPYIVRPVAGACVSTPLLWDELDGGLDPRMFDITNVGRRVREGGDVFRGTLEDRQELLPAIERLGRELG